MPTMTAAQLISLSISESRTVTEYPETREQSERLLEDLGVECADDWCDLREVA